MRNIILLDLDGVLIQAWGYRLACRMALEYFFAQLGQKHLSPPEHADMLAFEAQSIIFEWDSAAIMAAALLNQASDLWGEKLEDSIKNIAQSGLKFPQLDWVALAKICPPAQAGIHPAQNTLGKLFPDVPPMRELLGDPHSVTAPMTRLIQNFVLGTEGFTQAYGLPAWVDSPSMLQAHDRAKLDPALRDRLSAEPGVYPVIYTARPSYPPSFEANRLGYSPEAELGQKLLAWEHVPMAAYGLLQYLAKVAGADTSGYVKPAPAHALLAIFAALAYPSPNWEARAIALSQAPQNTPPAWFKEPWRVIVFEDSPNSIRGVREAVAYLAAYHPLGIECLGVGVSHDPQHQAALEQTADWVVEDLNAGIKRALGWS
jgi:beta-phosphoglucomutase-like phosphatase (HAD superfamily)